MSTPAFVIMGLVNLWAAFGMWKIGNYGLLVVFVCYSVACFAYIWGAR